MVRMAHQNIKQKKQNEYINNEQVGLQIKQNNQQTK
jgi:hypothetical protein